MTLNRFIKLLRAQQAMHGHRHVHVEKDSFTHPLDKDGSMMLQVESVDVQWVTLVDGDGFAETTKAGRERGSVLVVLRGDRASPANQLPKDQS